MFFKNVNICKENIKQKNLKCKSEAKPCKTSDMEPFSEVVNGTSSTYNAWLSSQYTCKKPFIQSEITCSMLAIETLEEGVKYVKSQQ